MSRVSRSSSPSRASSRGCTAPTGSTPTCFPTSSRVTWSAASTTSTRGAGSSTTGGSARRKVSGTSCRWPSSYPTSRSPSSARGRSRASCRALRRGSRTSTAPGHVPNRELMEIVRRARVVVIPSRCQDAGPLVPLEALATATPVVAYANGGLAEYVVDSGGGRVVPVDSTALAEVAAELHEDEDAWRAHSERGLEAVVRRHTTEVYVPQLEQIYERARSRAHRRRRVRRSRGCSATGRGGPLGRPRRGRLVIGAPR